MELHDLVPVHIAKNLLPSESQTRTAFRGFGLGSSTACGGIVDSFIEGAKEKKLQLVKRNGDLGFFALGLPVSAEFVAINRRSKTHDAVNSDDSHACVET